MTLSVHGLDAVLVGIACLLFLVAAIAAWLSAGEGVPAWRPRVWPFCVSAGLFLWALAALVH